MFNAIQPIQSVGATRMARFLQTTRFSYSLHISLITESGRSFRTFQDYQDMPHIEETSLSCGRQEQEQVGVPSRFLRGSVSYYVIPISIMSRLTQSIHICFVRPLFSSQVVQSQESFFRRIIGLAYLRVQTTSVLFSCTFL